MSEYVVYLMVGGGWMVAGYEDVVSPQPTPHEAVMVARNYDVAE